METNQIINFMQAYKDLDELCRQIFSVERGISAYIDEMERKRERGRFVDYWDDDYKQLKHLRWVRNKLVHESDSFEDNLFNLEDIEWLKWFRSQIIERADPLAKLYDHRERQTTVPRNVTSNHVKKHSVSSPSISHISDYRPNHVPKKTNISVLKIITYSIVVIATIIALSLYLYYSDIIGF